MKIFDKNINIEDIIEEIDIDQNIPLKRKNGLILRESHIEILKRNGINYENHTSLNSLIFEIEEVLNEGTEDAELEWLSEELSEINYYNYTNK
jgi:hypothetical protein